MNYKTHSNDHDFFSEETVKNFLRNHQTGITNLGRQALGRILAAYDNPTVLDVACGSAVNWECWKRMGVKCDYTGFDLTDKLLAHARGLYGEEITLVQGYAQELDQYFGNNSQHVVVLRHILEHLPHGQYEEVVRKAFEIAESELVIVLFLDPIDEDDHRIEERSSGIEGRPEVTHFWNTYSWRKMSTFLAELGGRISVSRVMTPGAAHADTIIRLQK
jgi:ubiquinone/menaquinone biosynthesis C-methylase UbiE